MSAPDSGTILLDDINVTNVPFYDRARFGISYLPQAPFVPRSLSVEDNIALVLESRLTDAAARREKLSGLIAEFRLQSVRRSRVGELSGGQRRRCEIAITLACEPSFALLDEPFAGVDPKNTEEITNLIRHMTDREHRRSDHRSQGARTVAASSIAPM